MKIILKKAVISEKSMKMAKLGFYTFLVDKSSRKPAIKNAVEEQFGVKVVSVKTANYAGEKKIQRSRRGSYQTADFKKTIVKLTENQKINLFEAQSEVEADEENGKVQVKEKKSLLKGTKVKIEKGNKK